MSETAAAPAAAPTTSAPSTSTPTSTTKTASTTSKPKPAPKGGRMSVSDFNQRFLGSSVDDGDDSSPEIDTPDDVEGADFEQSVPELPTSEEPAEETEDLQSEETVEDLSWLDPIKAYKDGIHGIPVAELLQALASGTLPDALMKQIKVKLKDGDYEWEDTLDGTRRGAMMRRDYSKKTQELAQLREAFESERGDFAQMLNSWKSDPKALRQGLQRLGMPLLDAAKLLAEEHRMLAQMTPRERELYEENQKLRAAEEAQKFDQAKKARQDAKTESEAKWDRQVKFATDTGHAIFNELKMPLNKGTWQSFLRFLNYETSSQPGAEWTETMVRNAVEAAHEEYNELKRAVAAGEITQQEAAAVSAGKSVQAAPKQQATSPARQQAAAAGVTGGQRYDSGTAPKPRPKGGRMTVAEFNKRFT